MFCNVDLGYRIIGRYLLIVLLIVHCTCIDWGCKSMLLQPKTNLQHIVLVCLEVILIQQHTWHLKPLIFSGENQILVENKFFANKTANSHFLFHNNSPTLEYLIAVQDQIRAYRLAILVSYYIKMQDFGYFWPIFVLN